MAHLLKNIFYLLIFGSLLIACDNTKVVEGNSFSNKSGLAISNYINDNSNSLTLDKTYTPDQILFNLDLNKVEFSALFDVKKTITLADDVAIGTIDKVLADDGKLFILDRMRSVALHVFDDDGNFLYSISNTGKGPGEFTRIRDVCLDKESNEILLLDNYRILRYGYDSEYLGSSTIPIAANSIAISSNGSEILLALTHNSIPSPDLTYNLFAFTNTKEPKLVSNNFSFPLEYTSIDYSLKDYFFESSDKSPNFINIYNDTIYEISSQSITPKYVINYQNHTVPDKERNKKKFNSFTSDKIWGAVKFIESEASILIFSFNKDALFLTTYNKNSKNSKSYITNNIKDDLFMSTHMFPIGSTDNNFIFMLDPDRLHELIKQEKEKNTTQQYAVEEFKELSKQVYFKRILDKTTTSSNPVLILASKKQ